MTASEQGCHCLCFANHPAVTGICTGFAETALRFDSPATGLVDVAMCEACAAATMVERQDAQRALDWSP